ncbi:MAG: serine hydrolase domain-containing protein [Planctomycetota bacterium]|jgi:CubicO group peptidase (beta-lactamase class C family)
MRRLALLVLVLGAAHAEGSKLDGEWTLVLERRGMQPRVQKGVLVLERSGKKWAGSLRFPMILSARRHALSDVRVQGSRVRFKIEHARFTLEFEGRRKGAGLKGECKWKGLGAYPWTAFRAEGAEPQARFEKGLRFDRDLPKGDAKKLGFDGQALDRLIAAAREAQTDALLIVKDGRIVCERYFRGRRGRIRLMSVTKFLTAMAIALLVEEGKIASLDAPLSTWFDEWKEGRKARVTLRHVMAHTSGIRHGRTETGRPSARELNEQKDKVAYVRRQPLDDEPGAKFAYNNEAIALLSGVFTQAAGEPADAYLKRKLFDPLGIKDWAWNRDEAGHTVTYAECAMSARGLVRIGLLVARGGRWGKKTLFPDKWTRTLGDQPGSPHNERCGLIWWRLKDPAGYYHDGWLGQMLFVYPKRDLVAVRLRAWDGSEAPEHSFGGLGALLTAAAPR